MLREDAALQDRVHALAEAVVGLQVELSTRLEAAREDDAAASYAMASFLEASRSLRDALDLLLQATLRAA